MYCQKLSHRLTQVQTSLTGPRETLYPGMSTSLRRRNCIIPEHFTDPAHHQLPFRTDSKRLLVGDPQRSSTDAALNMCSAARPPMTITALGFVCVWLMYRHCAHLRSSRESLKVSGWREGTARSSLCIKGMLAAHQGPQLIFFFLRAQKPCVPFPSSINPLLTFYFISIHLPVQNGKRY